MQQSPEATAVSIAQVNEAAGWLRSPSYGETGGDTFSDDLTETAGLAGFNIRSGRLLDAIQAIYKLADGRILTGPWHGGTGGDPTGFVLAEDEFITEISGRAGRYVDQISITTNLRTYGPFGGNGGDVWSFPSSTIGGIFGRSGQLIDQIGFFYK
jgi:hypothetical protein